MRLGGGRTPAPDQHARVLWDLFVEEIRSAGNLRLLSLVSSFQRDPSWEAAPPWARDAFQRIADRLGPDR